MKKLTKANCTAYGIEVASQYDFTDDGSRFRGFIYKGMPMTQCYSEGVCYLSIRVDYIRRGCNFCYHDWRQTEESKLCDEFNGVEEFDPEKLVENLERVIAKVDELNRTVSVTEEELDNCIERIKAEIAERKQFVKGFTQKFAWWEHTKHEVTSAYDYMTWIMDDIKRNERIIATLKTKPIGVQREYIGRSSFLCCDWTVQQLAEWCK